MELRVVRGEATPEELAALVAAVRVVATRKAAAPTRQNRWRDHSRQLRRPGHHGPGAWRASGLP